MSNTKRSGWLADRGIACMIIILLIMPMAAFGAWTSDYLWNRGVSWEQGEWVLAMLPMGATVIFLSLRSESPTPGSRQGLLAGFSLTAIAAAMLYAAINVWFLLAGSFLYGAGVGLHMTWLARNASRLFRAPRASVRAAVHVLPAVAMYLLAADILPWVQSISAPDGGFLVGMATSVVALLTCLTTRASHASSSRLRIDPWLAILATVSLISLCLAFVRNVDHRKNVMSSIMLVIDGLVFAGLYLARLNTARGIRLSPRAISSTPLRRCLLSLLVSCMAAMAVITIVSLGNPIIDEPGSVKPEVRLGLFVISAFVAGPLLWAYAPAFLRSTFVPMMLTLASGSCFGLYLTATQLAWVTFSITAGAGLGGAITCAMMRLANLGPLAVFANPLRLGLAASFLGGTFGLVGAFSLMNQIYIGSLVSDPAETLLPGRPMRLADAMTLLDKAHGHEPFPTTVAVSVANSISSSLAILCISLAVAGILASVAPPPLHIRLRHAADARRK
ncbi:hypothetical protein KCV01_g13552, partial [Aureobasidium melanogenum]